MLILYNVKYKYTQYLIELQIICKDTLVKLLLIKRLIIIIILQTNVCAIARVKEVTYNFKLYTKYTLSK